MVENPLQHYYSCTRQNRIGKQKNKNTQQQQQIASKYTLLVGFCDPVSVILTLSMNSGEYQTKGSLLMLVVY